MGIAREQMRGPRCNRLAEARLNQVETQSGVRGYAVQQVWSAFDPKVSESAKTV